jgi:TolB-like protein
MEIMNVLKTWVLGLLLASLAACSTTVESTARQDAVDGQAQWALLPMTNNTDTPQAGLAAEDMVDHQLRRYGVVKLLRYPASLSRDSLFEPTERKVSEEALKWAKDQGVRFAVQGSVQEWHYKVGIDGEPAVGVTLQVIDLSDDRVVWSASAAKSGWSREALSAVAQKLLSDMLHGLPLSLPKTPG